jgi:hypothetical protein
VGARYRPSRDVTLPITVRRKKRRKEKLSVESVTSFRPPCNAFHSSYKKKKKKKNSKWERVTGSGVNAPGVRGLRPVKEKNISWPRRICGFAALPAKKKEPPLSLRGLTAAPLH